MYGTQPPPHFALPYRPTSSHSLSRKTVLQRPSFRSTDPPAGRPPRAAYYDGAGAGAGTGGNAFINGGAGSVGGYKETPATQPSPFKRGPASTNAFLSGTGGGSDLGGGYGGARYNSQVGAAGSQQQQQQQQSFSFNGGFSSEVALVPVEANGGANRGRNVMDDDDGDDDDMPTRSLVDDPDVHDDGPSAAAAAAGAAGGLRYRPGRGGGEGSRTGHGGGGGASAGGGVGGFNAEPDALRATWVVVWGVPPDMANEVLTRFLQFGHVEEQRGQPGSNWLYMK